MPAGVYAANCYIVYSEKTKAGIIVDPGGDADDLINTIDENCISLKYIVLTHGHGDHIGGVKALQGKYKVPLLIHEDESELLRDGIKNLSSVMATGTIELVPDRTLKDGDIIEFGDLSAKIIHTPGHTKGGICLLINDILITGDTLFKHSIGRTDLQGGNPEDLLNAIKQKILVLPDDTVIFPGHGEKSTIESEKLYNPFLRRNNYGK